MLIELAAGYPDRLYRAAGHPVSWIGWLIGWLDRSLNLPAHSQNRRRLSGVIALLTVVLVSGGSAWLVQALLGGAFVVFAALLASSLIAQRSLGRHVADVADALDVGGLEEGRLAVSRIVGRDTAMLDEAGVSRAAIESLAENFSDGVVAPVFWLAVAGLPGASIYKAVNTADSMIGHRTARHEAFGWASARLDDIVNLPASRLSAMLIVIAASLIPDADPRGAWNVLWRDAHRHRSPNAGWPEAAMAGALGLSLAGPREYGGVAIDDAFMGQGGRREATRADIRRALRVYRAADALLLALVGLSAALFILHG